MNIIIANDFDSLLSQAGIPTIKYIVGSFNVNYLKEQFEHMYFEHMVLDISALQEADKIETIKMMSESFDMSKVVLLLNNNPIYNSKEYLSTIISFGIYNFTKNIDGVNKLLTRANTYKDVAKYHNVKKDIETNNEVSESKAPSFISNSQYQKAYNDNTLSDKDLKDEIEKIKMQETVKQSSYNQYGSRSNQKKHFDIIYQLILGFALLPLMTLLLSIIYYYGLELYDRIFKNYSAVNHIFKYNIISGITPIIILITLVIMLIMGAFYRSLDRKLLNNGKRCGKFSLISFSLFAIIVFGNHYFLDNILYNIIPIDNLSNNLLTNMAVLEIIVYFIRLFIYSHTEVNYNYEESDRLTIFEIILSICLGVVISLYSAMFIATVFINFTFFNNIYSALDNLLIISKVITILLIPLTIFCIFHNLLQRKTDE